MFPWERVKFSALVAALLAGAVVATVAANAFYPSPALVGAAKFSAAGALLFGLAAFVLGVGHLARSRAELRRTLAVLGAITLAVLVLHLYIINSPPSSSDSSVSGGVNSTFQDQYASVTSTLAGSHLAVTVRDAGSNAISRVQVLLDGEPLPASGFNHLPSATNPLEPSTGSSLGYATSVGGSWEVQASPSSTLAVDYSYLSCFHVPNANDTRAVYGCVMDETYYVPSALGILSGTQCAPYADSCNLEHPPLAKALIAAGIAVFGLNDFGYRISSVVLGTLSIPLLFVLCYAASGSRRVSYFATLLFAADTLFFVHSSAALIDVPAVFFTLLGCVLYFNQTSWWRVNNYLASGVIFGLAALSKETAVFALAAVVSFELLLGGTGLRESSKRVVEMVVPAILVFAGATQLYDSTLASSSLPWFYQHISFMLTYGAGLKGGGWTGALFGGYITPIDWVLAYTPVSYLVTNVTVTSAGSTVSYVGVGYYGVANLIIVWMLFLWVPLALHGYLKGRAAGAVSSREDLFGLFLVVWFLWSYVPYIALWAYGRVTYPFYILPAIPALAAGAAYFLSSDWFPRKIAVVYVLAAFLIFFLYFPVKDFLPVFVRAWLAR